MPEYAELHQSSHKVAAASAGFTFTRAATRGRVPPKAGTVGVGDHERAEMQVLPATADWGSFELFARHRGKEVGIVLVERADNAHPVIRRPAFCPTCISVHKHRSGGENGLPDSDGVGTPTDASAPKCHHGEHASLQQVKKAGANKGRYFFSCYLPMWRSKKGALSRCPFFQWADEHVGGALLSSDEDRSHVDAFFQEREHTGDVDAAASAGCSPVSQGKPRVRVVRLTFRRGMKGRFVLLSKEQVQAAEKAEGGDADLQNDLRSAHFSFERSDGARLLFIDKRPR